MAIGTIGGKLGYAASPVFAVGAMFISVRWFGISEDEGPWYALAGWILFGVATAVVGGFFVRWIANHVFKVGSRTF